MQNNQDSKGEREKLRKFASRGTAHFSFREEGAEAGLSPIQKIGKFLKKGQIAVFVVATAGFSGMVHDRFTNDDYRAVDLGTAVMDVSRQMIERFDIRPAYEGFATNESVTGGVVIDDAADWFTSHNIRTPGVGRALAESGVQWIGSGYVETGRPDSSVAISPEALMNLIVQVKEMNGGDLRRAVRLLDHALETYLAASALCEAGDRLFCEVLESSVGGYNHGYVEFDTSTQVVAAYAPDGELLLTSGEVSGLNP